MRSAPDTRGFTLVELMLALAIAGIVLAVGVPGLGAWLAEQELQDRADALRHALDFARSEAIKRGGRVDLCPGSGSCSGGAVPWEGGWVVVADSARGSGSPSIARERRAPPGITIRGNRPVADYVSYTSLGQARRFDGALQMGTFIVCRSGQRARRVVLAASGRVRVEASTEACP
ncbi:MAG TPA: GspH/FimT family pseudopilin [Casimicrobiaceae bacterium]